MALLRFALIGLPGYGSPFLLFITPRKGRPSSETGYDKWPVLRPRSSQGQPWDAKVYPTLQVVDAGSIPAGRILCWRLAHDTGSPLSRIRLFRNAGDRATDGQRAGQLRSGVLRCVAANLSREAANELSAGDFLMLAACEKRIQDWAVMAQA